MNSGMFFLGQDQNYPRYLNDKIKTSNEIALLIAFVGLSYTIFSLIYYPSLAIYPITCIVIACSTYLLNYLGLVYISRIILSVLVLILAFLYHANLVNTGEPFITSLFCIELVLTIVPWILIDLREKVLLVFVVGLSYIILFSQSSANELITTELDSTIYRGGFLNYASYAFAVFILVGCLYFLQSKTFTSERENTKLYDDLNNQKQLLETQKSEIEQTLSEVENARKKDQEKAWVNKGIAELDEILRDAKDEDIYPVVISKIINYLSVNQGAIYEVTKDEMSKKPFIIRKSTYAYQRHKHIQDKYAIDESLLGQVYQSGETLFMTEIPKDYVKITSGLGEALPNAIVICPMKRNKDIFGMVELASFKVLEPFEIDYLEIACEHIAIFMKNIHSNMETTQLLEKTQMQAEEMRAQEEEMKQSMEELQAIQEEMYRKEKEYLEKIADLEEVIIKNKLRGKIKTFQ